MIQALMPDALRDFVARWHVRPVEIAHVLGTTPAALAEAIATDTEPEGVSYQGAALAGVIYFLLKDRAKHAGSDAAVAAWLDQTLFMEWGQRRAARMFGARTIEEIAVWAEAPAEVR